VAPRPAHTYFSSTLKKLCTFALLWAALVSPGLRAQEQTVTPPAEQIPAPLVPEAPAPTAPAPTPGTAALFPEAGATTEVVPPLPRAGRGNGQRRNGGRGKRANAAGIYATEAAGRRADADPLEVRVAFRRAKTQAMARDPGLRELLIQADEAPTDDIKREHLRAYYTRLYASVCKIDRSPALKAHVALLAKVSEQRYDPKRFAISGEDDLVGGRGGGRNRR
jgi:hypothetical protein